MDTKTLICLLLIGMILIFSESMSVGAQQGCCSWHGGIAYCDTCVGRYMCNDGEYSPTCTCTYLPGTCGGGTTTSTTTTITVAPSTTTTTTVPTSTSTTTTTTTIPLRNLIVHFIDVGQGDAILIEKDDNYVLVDCGGSDDKITSYLIDEGITEINYLITTHPDADHIGGCDAVLKDFDVEHVWDNGQSADTLVYQDYITLAHQRNYSVVYKGYSIDLNSVQIQILSPFTPYPTGDRNDNSIVAKVTYGSIDFMLTGDCTVSCENNLEGGLESEILKVGHHGSSSSTSQDFLDKVDPKAAIISVGAANPYGHPSPIVIERLTSRDISVYRTDLGGKIVVTADTSSYILETKSAKTTTTSTLSTITTSTTSTTIPTTTLQITTTTIPATTTTTTTPTPTTIRESTEPDFYTSIGRAVVKLIFFVFVMLIGYVIYRKIRKS